MTTQRQVAILAASAILRGLSIDLKDTELRQSLVGLSLWAETSTTSELESEVSRLRAEIRALQDSLRERGSLPAIIMTEALSGVNLLLMP